MHSSYILLPDPIELKLEKKESEPELEELEITITPQKIPEKNIFKDILKDDNIWNVILSFLNDFTDAAHLIVLLPHIWLKQLANSGDESYVPCIAALTNWIQLSDHALHCMSVMEEIEQELSALTQNPCVKTSMIMRVVAGISSLIPSAASIPIGFKNAVITVADFFRMKEESFQKLSTSCFQNAWWISKNIKEKLDIVQKCLYLKPDFGPRVNDVADSCRALSLWCSDDFEKPLCPEYYDFCTTQPNTTSYLIIAGVTSSALLLLIYIFTFKKFERFDKHERLNQCLIASKEKRKTKEVLSEDLITKASIVLHLEKDKIKKFTIKKLVKELKKDQTNTENKMLQEEKSPHLLQLKLKLFPPKDKVAPLKTPLTRRFAATSPQGER